MEDRLLVTPAPHITSSKTVRGIMLDVVVSLVPASIAAVVIFGVRSLLII